MMLREKEGAGIETDMTVITYQLIVIISVGV